MKKCIIGKKIGMTQLFDENGNIVPVTVVEAGDGFDLVDALLELPRALPAYALPPEAEYHRYNP